ncbi:MAG TPA: hypothetical protein VFV34_03965 [Blastocatellia bacterium]|nr:hypothetical protein [Blastocatellia bacterium]
MRYAVMGAVIGVALQVLVRFVVAREFLFAEAAVAGSFGATLLLLFGERRRGLPTVDDMRWERSKEKIDPLGLKRN